VIVKTSVYAINHPPEPPAFVGAEPKPRVLPFYFLASAFVSATAIPAAIAPVKKNCTLVHIEGQGDVFCTDTAEAICERVVQALPRSR